VVGTGKLVFFWVLVQRRLVRGNDETWTPNAVRVDILKQSTLILVGILHLLVAASLACQSIQNIQKVFSTIEEDREGASWLQDKFKHLLHIIESIFPLQDTKTWLRVAFVRQNPEEHAIRDDFVSLPEQNHVVLNAT